MCVNDPSGVAVKKLVMCTSTSTWNTGPKRCDEAEALLRLIDESDEQINWVTPRHAVTRADARLARLRWRVDAMRRQGHDRRGL